jgi:alpha-glucosidase
MKDFGYDVSDYRDVHPMFGTLEDMDALIAAAHERGLKIILDFVPNHTSDQHPWFIESRSSRHNPKRDWYIWKDPAPDGGPPNNWLGRFDGKPAWEFDEKTGQYYLHSFLKEQPDLNWRNEGLREAMLDNMRFWYERGVDGFRVDVSYRVMKDPGFPDNPPNPDYTPGEDDPHKQLIERYTKNTPDIHMFNRWLRDTAEEYEDRVLIGEINLDLPELVAHYGDDDEFHLPFNFRLIYEPWTAESVRNVVETFEELTSGGEWPNYVLSNHDRSRFPSRTRPQQARNGMLLLLTLRGTPTMYYGEELGMEDVHIPQEKVQDPWELYTPGMGLGRDPVRTPMQWSAQAKAGFTEPDVEPWLPLSPVYETVNVEAQRSMPRSMLSLVTRLIALRREHRALTLGGYATLPTPEGVYGYTRGDAFAVLLNFTDEEQTTAVAGAASVVLSTRLDSPDALRDGQVTLRPNEGLLLALA